MHNVNGPNINMLVMGIKCDNPECDFADMSVKVEDYPLWLNKECPICGANLLTQADYDILQKTLKLGKIFNKISLPKEKQSHQAEMYGTFNGTGKIMVSDINLTNE